MRSTLLRSIALIFLIAVAAASSAPAAAAVGATITVNSTGDTDERDEKLTLREAMMLATGTLAVATLDEFECDQVSNSSPGPPCTTTDDIGGGFADTIVFDTGVFPPPPASPATIDVEPSLPELSTGDDTVDGSGAGVIVRGLSQYMSTQCFTVNSNNNVIQGLQVRECFVAIGVGDGAQGNTIGPGNVIVANFVGIAIVDPGTSGNQVIGNDVGFIDGGPPSPDGNDWAGIHIGGDATGNTVGGPTPAERNVIAGNGGNGVDIQGSNGNTIIGNYIGTTPDGMDPLGNNTGVNLSDAQDNTIGGTAPGEENVISGNNRTGVHMSGSSAQGNRVMGNYIGTNAAGTDGLGGQAGVQIRHGAHDNTIGGASPEERNVISGNGDSGVRIEESGTRSNVVIDNYIGTNAAGTDGLGGQRGVDIGWGTQENVIGGSAGGEANLISGNGDHGVVIQGTGTAHNRVIGNRIGTNEAGTAAIPNGNHGVAVWFGAWANSVGGWGAGEGNLISGNGQDGVNVWNSGTFGNRVINNYIGTDVSGTAALPNAGNGVGIGNQAENTAVSSNLISGNSQNGVGIGHPGTSGNTISDNLIGTNFDGSAALGNGGPGVSIQDAENNTIGYRDGNVISGNGGQGVDISGSESYGNQVYQNYIGLNADGSGVLPNGWAGVSIDQGAHDNTIDGYNVISGHGTGIAIQNGSNHNVVRQNYIGTDQAGGAALPNNQGIQIQQGAHDNLIGGTGQWEGNLISGNSDWGIVIQGGGTTGNQVAWNQIGVTSACCGDPPLPNRNGVGLQWGAQDNIIGPSNLISGNIDSGVAFQGGTSGNRVISNFIGTGWGGGGSIPNGVGISAHWGDTQNTIGGAGEGNVISGNNGPGIYVESASGLEVLSNLIGTDMAGTGPLPNGGAGVELAGCAQNNTIGRPGEGAIIAFNGGDGVYVHDGCTTFNTIRGNSIHSHVPPGLGIENWDGGNWEIPGPVILSQNPITGTTCPNCTVDIYTDYEDEGLYYEGSVVAGIGGNFTFSGTLFGPWLTATTTDTFGNTSEFTPPVPVIDIVDTDGDGIPDSEDACPTVAEVIDANEDEDGCPDPDNDVDGFPDSADDCPGTDWTAGPNRIHCQDPGEPDYDDNVNTCEDYDGVIDTDGCHDSPGDDYDGDLLSDDAEVFVYLTDPTDPDTDGDGCADGEEALGPNPVLGGTRDPNDPWDFYDVPVPTLHSGGTMYNRDKAVSMLRDVLAVLEYTGTSQSCPDTNTCWLTGNADACCSDNPNSKGIDYDEDMDGDRVADGVAYDRSLGDSWPELGPGKNHSAEPDGAVTMLMDVLLVLAQTPHSCQAAP